MPKEVKYPFPTDEYFMTNKNCNDRIYAYLLIRSRRNVNGRETHRYVERMTNEKIAEDLGISRNTVGKRLKDLITYGYVEKEGKYYLVPKHDYYQLVPLETLDFLLNYIENKERIIKLYVMLLDFYVKHKTFTMIDLHIALGYKLVNNKPNSNNSKHIRTCMMILSEAGLIKYNIKEGRNSKGSPTSMYEIVLMRSNIDDKYKNAYKTLKENGEVETSYEAIKDFYDNNNSEIPAPSSSN